MKINLKIGQRISLIDDNLSGVVTKIVADEIYFSTDDGFELSANRSQVIKDEAFDVAIPEDIELLLTEKEKVYQNRKIPTKKLKGIVPPMEVDLHIHQLTSSERGLSAHDKLNLQIDTARHKLEFAIRKRIQRIVFIHGVGEGVLRAELEYLFSRYDNIKFYDANYQQYGLGATEVYIFQN
ncbi:Smr/MutS family protein [Leeuwenhoekiella sp. MAR_2009_132]|uniref:Smr/MutS family protein n=1 Tax=Leeuwenhoekiella sp. MAR_2009_132 TaxID=1392489 RepID=UPI00048F08A3|nr:Smr/MutS family protein [Leeuwenhoekiella sp. MAR_2009_132]